MSSSSKNNHKMVYEPLKVVSSFREDEDEDEGPVAKASLLSPPPRPSGFVYFMVALFVLSVLSLAAFKHHHCDCKHNKALKQGGQAEQPCLEDGKGGYKGGMMGNGHQQYGGGGMMGGGHHGHQEGMMGGGPGPGMMGGGHGGDDCKTIGDTMMGDATMGQHMCVIHHLLDHHDLINRTIEEDNDETSPVIVTTTTSQEPQVSRWIQMHVSQMMERMKNDQPVRMWDPLFVQLFDHASEIEQTVSYTENGVQVHLEGTTACGMSLADLHAHALSKFVKYGWDVAHEAHDPSDKCS